MRLGRRHFVKKSLGAAGAAAVFSNLFARRASADAYGDIIPDPAGVLDLPEGFSYVVLQEAGDAMDDGYVVPGRPDGMACFAGADEGTWVLMRNHEVSANDDANGAYGSGEAPPEAYDPDGFGGVSRIVIDAQDGSVVSSNLVLTGTVRNCAGGPSPWGWLSCEESVETDHGYVFACPEGAASVVQAEPIIGFGRFNHEAAAVDPDTLVTYLTEDRGDGCLYRHVPNSLDTPFEGRLQALRIVDEDAFNTAPLGTVGQNFEVAWVDIDDPNPSGDTLRFTARQDGAASFTRGEGLWFFEGQVYFSCTNGGPVGLGQIFRLVDDGDTGTLELVAVSDGEGTLDFPDNITVAPWGELFICEDGGSDQYIRILTPDGTLCDFARNALSGSELAGACFSPDGSALFVNIQGDGLTLMITGPFPEIPSGGDESTGGDESSGGDDETGSDDPTGDAETGDGNSASGTTAPGTSTETAGADTDGESGTDGSSAGGSSGGGGCSVDGNNAAGVAVLAGLAITKATSGEDTDDESISS